mgnify:CR=1 FL=1
MINPRLLSVPVFAKTTLTTAVSTRNGTGATLLYTVPATGAYDFAPPPAFSATSGWVVESATRSARAQGLRINRISAIAQGTSAEGVLLVFHGTDLIDQINVAAVTVTATTLSAQAVLAYGEGLLLPPGAEIRVALTAISAATTVTLEGLLG